MMIFVIQGGSYRSAKMDYSYARRAQSVVQTLHWRDIAILEASSVEDAVSEAKAVVAEWVNQGLAFTRWRIEGRGNAIGVIDIDPDELRNT